MDRYLYGLHWRITHKDIRVAPEWQDGSAFEAWVLRELGPRPAGSVFQRIDLDGDYEPGNVHWTEDRRRSNDVLTTEQVETAVMRHWRENLSYSQIAREMGVSPHTLRQRAARL